MAQNWEEWWIQRQAVLDPARPGWAGELGREEPDGVQQWQGQGPAPGEEQPAELLSSRSAPACTGTWACTSVISKLAEGTLITAVSNHGENKLVSSVVG